jgi:ABC-type phosphate transport system permease subunit
MLNAGIVLAIMILPITAALCREVFAQTPRLHEEAALALGATRWEMIRLAVFPYARSGMVSAIMLGLGRALGETMAVAMVLSAAPVVTLNLISSSNPATIASNIATNYKEATPDKQAVLIATGLVLFAFTFAVNFLARWIAGRGERKQAKMTSTIQAPKSDQMTRSSLPRQAPAIMVAVSLASGVLIWLLSDSIGLGGLTSAAVMAFGTFAWATAVEGRRSGVDKLITTLVWLAFLGALIPLLWLLFTVLKNGLPVINAQFLTYSMRNVLGDAQGGLYHALIGTVLITLGAALISVPVGIFAAIYLVEYGAKSRLARWVTFLVDVMTGIPSIVAGLFALSLFVLIFGPAVRFGLGGSVALSLLMIPDGRTLDRGDAATGAQRPARGVVRPGRAQVAHHHQGGAAHRARGHRHRCRAGHLASHRGDRSAAGGRGLHRLGQHQHVRRPDDDAAGVHLHPIHRVDAEGSVVRLGWRARPDRHRDAAQLDRSDHRQGSSLRRRPEPDPDAIRRN